MPPSILKGALPLNQIPSTSPPETNSYWSIGMHELSIALNILDVVAEEAKLRGDVPVTAIHLRIGPLSGVVPCALRSAFDLAREQSAWPAAELLIEEVPVVSYCPACNAERVIESIQELRCPVCGTPTPQVVRGRELEIAALEIAS